MIGDSVLLGHPFDHVHRVFGGARGSMLGVDVAGPVEASQFLEDERVVDLARSRFESSRVVANLHELDQFVLKAIA